ncbi:hypothetical protein L810_6545 [Burkholderia sp. AU4i]|nr:hypothetical protein L810_6545 [Burkholderia sp. AU4i]
MTARRAGADVGVRVVARSCAGCAEGGCRRVRHVRRAGTKDEDGVKQVRRRAEPAPTSNARRCARSGQAHRIRINTAPAGCR